MNRSEAAAVVVAFFVVVSLIFVHLRLCKPLAEITTTIKQIVDGKQNLEIPCATRRDEIGEIARVLVTFRKNRSEEHTSELQSLMRISYAVFCLKKTKRNNKN